MLGVHPSIILVAAEPTHLNELGESLATCGLPNCPIRLSLRHATAHATRASIGQ